MAVDQFLPPMSQASSASQRLRPNVLADMQSGMQEAVGVLSAACGGLHWQQSPAS